MTDALNDAKGGRTGAKRPTNDVDDSEEDPEGIKIDTKSILEEADETVAQRAEEYGPPTENFSVIANLWSAYLDVEITPYDYAQMMVLAKIGRTRTGEPDRDTHQDQCGYSFLAEMMDQEGES